MIPYPYCVTKRSPVHGGAATWESAAGSRFSNFSINGLALPCTVTVGKALLPWHGVQRGLFRRFLSAIIPFQTPAHDGADGHEN